MVLACTCPCSILFCLTTMLCHGVTYHVPAPKAVGRVRRPGQAKKPEASVGPTEALTFSFNYQGYQMYQYWRSRCTRDIFGCVWTRLDGWAMLRLKLANRAWVAPNQSESHLVADVNWCEVANWPGQRLIWGFSFGASSPSIPSNSKSQRRVDVLHHWRMWDDVFFIDEHGWKSGIPPSTWIQKAIQ